ncbi:NAD(P)H-binding protein [Saccharopolyspora sp. CA-218241]|uniref:NAD(P)H-binding protein n=1 Tax=Saccharopolyspora sp. CA-218241 TaxID=3240027 RepID=UPI003D9566AA
MHHLVIGEGQIGREIIARAIGDGDTVTILRRSEVQEHEDRGISRVTGDVLDPAALEQALRGADAVHACFHAPYDSRIWRRDLPPREEAVLDAAARHDVPIVFPESMYPFVGLASDLREGAEFAPRDEKGRIRRLLIDRRRAHAARTTSIVASDLVGPTSLGTGASVACTTVIEPVLADRRAVLPGALDAPHSLTFIPDLATAMLHTARHLDRLPADGVLHAPTAPPRTMRELAGRAADVGGVRRRAPLGIPRRAMRAAAPFSTLARELSRLEDLWHRPCALAPGILTTQEGLEPTPWEDAVDRTVAAARERSTSDTAIPHPDPAAA